jgi:AcrR family transcriptional regulator
MSRSSSTPTKVSDGPASPARRRGRPSIATSRRAEIIEAYVECIRAHGIAGATVDKVAQSLGVSRTLVFHYFGDMQSLSRAVVEHIITTAVRTMAEARRGLALPDRRQALVDFAVNGPNIAELRDAIVLAEVNALAGHDEAVAAMLAEMWEVWIAAVVDELLACFPNASRRQCEGVGYALACLGEQHWWLTVIGPGARRRDDARRAVESLLATLQTSGEPK